MDLTELTLESFLINNHKTQKDLDDAAISFEDLKLIAIEYQKIMPSLSDVAELIAKTLQKNKHVHSVRWRVKDPEHLMEKIIRRRIKNVEKYLSIDASNYTEIVTDLVGVRVLHLFKYEWKEIHDYILGMWKTHEDPVAYIRSGDEGDIIDSYGKYNLKTEVHPFGYRSIHFVTSTQPTLQKVLSEIQVRTIFEEGWSEIDHELRYPNFSDNKLISYFLTIFNRMAGSADEMGSFVKELAAQTTLHNHNLVEIYEEQEQQLLKIEALASELESEKIQNAGKVNELKDEIKKLRTRSYTKDALSNLGISATAALDAMHSPIYATGALDESMMARVNAMSSPIFATGALDESMMATVNAMHSPIYATGALDESMMATVKAMSSPIFATGALDEITVAPNNKEKKGKKYDGPDDENK
jgi:ppGpp synthetase/RelA/SpoT-type nucleotidyltranferase